MIATQKKPSGNIAIRDTLFGDLPLDHWAGTESNGVPWDLFKNVKRSIEDGNNDDAIETLKQIISIPGLESRHYLQAYFFLNDLTVTPGTELTIFGVVAEVAMDEGVDLLAVYADHSARYYNFSGSGVIWDTADETISKKIDHILMLGTGIVKQIGPWNAPRPAEPVNGRARINFLTSGGLHFDEEDQNVLFSDPFSSPIMYAMLDMMETLINKTRK